MKKNLFFIAAIAAALIFCAVAESPLESNNLDPSNGGEILLASIVSILLLSVAPATGNKKKMLVCLCTGLFVACVFGKWALITAGVYAVIAMLIGGSEEMKNFFQKITEAEADNDELLP